LLFDAWLRDAVLSGGRVDGAPPGRGGAARRGAQHTAHERDTGFWLPPPPSGLALQGVRDNPRRMSALGFSVTAHRILAYSFASVIAALGGILLVWQNAQVVPGTAGIPQVIGILGIAAGGG